jgi:hypothetical protein
MLVGARLRGCWCLCGVEGPHSLMSGAKGTATVTACHFEFLERRKGMSRGQQQFEDPTFWEEGEGKPRRSDHQSSINVVNRSTSLSREPYDRKRTPFLPS